MELTPSGYVFEGGISPRDLVARFGQPLYVYEGETIIKKYGRLKNAFNVPNLGINYACKANTNPHLLRLLKEQGSGLDCVSVQEIGIGLLAGYAPESIVFTPNGISEAELDEAVALGVHVNLDNVPILTYYGNRYPGRPVGIRIKPNIMAGGNLKISTGHIHSKFGIDVRRLDEVVGLCRSFDMRVTGIHMHTGSDIKDAAAFVEGAEVLFGAAMLFPDLEYIDFGSGFKVPYHANDKVTDIEALGALLSQRFQSFCSEYGRNVKLVLEPGKMLVSEAGFLLVQCNVVKSTPGGVTFAGIDSGFNHLIRPTMYEAYHHITNLDNPHGQEQRYDVVGYICETDTFAAERQLPEIRQGDLLCLHNAGAYAYTMASNYNSRPRPAEVLIRNGEAKLIRRRETLEDLLSTVI